MSQLPWKPIRLRNLEQQIDQAFDELIHGQWGLCPPSGNWQPEIDIFETPDFYLVEADVPGVDPDEIRLATIRLRGEIGPGNLHRTSAGKLSPPYPPRTACRPLSCQTGKSGRHPAFANP